MRSSNDSSVRRGTACGARGPVASDCGPSPSPGRVRQAWLSAGRVATCVAAVFAVFAIASVGAVESARADDALAPPTLAALLAGFRTMPGFEARFEEEKTLALLAAPLMSRGRLFFSPPGTLLRRVERPNPHDILIDDHVVRIATPQSADAGTGAPGGASPRARRIETIDLARRADVRPLVESMLWIFSGDLAELESVYAIDYRVLEPVASGRWQLRLAPRREPLSRLIRELAIFGHRHGADRLEITETSGDRTTTRILDANPARRFAEGELERLFGLEAK